MRQLPMEIGVMQASMAAGNAPTLLSLADLNKVAETWMNTSHAIFDDDEAHKVTPGNLPHPNSPSPTPAPCIHILKLP